MVNHSVNHQWCTNDNVVNHSGDDNPPIVLISMNVNEKITIVISMHHAAVTLLAVAIPDIQEMEL